MNLFNKGKKTNIFIGVCVVVLSIIAFRIYNNMMLNQQRAQRVFQGSTVSVETAVVKRQDIVPTLVFSANLEPIWSADVSPKFDARLEKLYVNEGDYVKKGQVIAQMDVSELSAQIFQLEGTLYEALADSQDAQLSYERNDRLYKQDAISLKELDVSKARRNMTQGRYNSAQGALKVLQDRLNQSTITAPQSGVVTRRFVYAGNFIKSGSPIVSIADIQTLLAKADISEGQIADIYIGAKAQIKVEAYKDKEFSGTISRISPMAELPARTFKTEITVPNNDEVLRAGMFATVFIKGNIRKSAIVIPQTAIVMREDQKTVYIVNKDNVVQQKLLQTGATADGLIEVLGGIEEGETIVVGGQNKLRQGAKIATSEQTGIKK